MHLKWYFIKYTEILKKNYSFFPCRDRKIHISDIYLNQFKFNQEKKERIHSNEFVRDVLIVIFKIIHIALNSGRNSNEARINET